MTDGSNLTPGGEMNDASSVVVQIRFDAEGHCVDWTKGDDRGSPGPYPYAEIAKNVRAAKELELMQNYKPIDATQG